MAVYPVQPGNPDYSSTGVNAYIPAIYSALLVKKFYPETVFSKISNTDYEGDIKSQGDTVNIRTRPTIETFRYKKGMVLPVQNPESPYIQLKIDQGEGFSFALDKVDEFQADIKLMNVWGEDAGKQMAQVIDRNVLISIAAKGADLSAGASANISGYTTSSGPDLSTMTLGSSTSAGAIVAGGYTVRGTAIGAANSGNVTPGVGYLGQSDAYANMITVGNSADIVKQVLLYGRFMNENNAPKDGRFAILPSYYYQLLKDIALPFGQAYATGQNLSNALTGNVPKIDGFDIIFSNNLPIHATLGANNVTPIIFGHSYATTFATQITESRIIDNPFAFGKMMQGLQVYGFNVIKAPLVGVDFWKSA